MARRDKREEAIRKNTKNVRFEELIAWLLSEGFEERKRTGTSHRVFSHPKLHGNLPLQDDNGKAKSYQVRQAILAVDKVREQD